MDTIAKAAVYGFLAFAGFEGPVEVVLHLVGATRYIDTVACPQPSTSFLAAA